MPAHVELQQSQTPPLVCGKIQKFRPCYIFPQKKSPAAPEHIFIPCASEKTLSAACKGRGKTFAYICLCRLCPDIHLHWNFVNILASLDNYHTACLPNKRCLKGEMKQYESDRSAGTPKEAFAASSAAGAPKKAAYAGHSQLEQMHLEARFRTKNGMPLDANVPPLPILQTPGEAYAQDNRQPPQSATEFAQQPVPSLHEENAGRQRTPPAGISGAPEAYASEPASGESESSSLHTMLIGSLITASVAIGLSSSLWINSLDKTQRGRSEISLWEVPESPAADTAAASSGSDAREIKNGIKKAMNGVGQWLLTSFGLAQQTVKQSLAKNTHQDSAAAAGGAENHSLLADGDEPIAQLPQDTLSMADPRPAPLPEAASADQPASPSPPLPAAAPPLPDESAQEKAKPPQAKPATTKNGTGARQKKTDERQAVASSRQKHKSRTKSRPASKSRHASAAIARSGRSSEIGRLKSQAFSETSSDRVKGKKSKRKPPLSDYIFLPDSESEKEGSTSHSGKTARVKAALAQCRHQSNFFRREYCKWQVCDGRWGKHGCPSFENKTASY